MGILSGTPGLPSHWHPHKPITSFMLQLLSFEAAAPLFSLPRVQLFCPPLVLHQQMSSSVLSAVTTPQSSGTTGLCQSAAVFLISLICCCFTSDLGYYKVIYRILPASLQYSGLGKQEIHSQSFSSELWTQDSMFWCRKCRALHTIESSGQSRANASWCPKHRLRIRAFKVGYATKIHEEKAKLRWRKYGQRNINYFWLGKLGSWSPPQTPDFQGHLASDPRVFPPHASVTVPALLLSSVGSNPGETVHSSLSPLINAEKPFISFLNGFSTGNGINKTIKLLPDMT